MRDHAPERLDQSRIRVHEEPEEPREPPERIPSQPRIRKQTVLGMPSIPRSSEQPEAADESDRSTPTSIESARGRAKASQKTMLGIPRPEFPQPPAAPAPSDREVARDETASDARPSHRARVRVRYDSGDEPLPVVQRRKRALTVLGVLVLFSAAWIAYRLFTLHG